MSPVPMFVPTSCEVCLSDYLQLDFENLPSKNWLKNWVPLVESGYDQIKEYSYILKQPRKYEK